MSYSYNPNTGALTVSASAGGASEIASFTVNSASDLAAVRSRKSALMGKYRDNPDMQAAVNTAFTDAINGVDAQLKGKKPAKEKEPAPTPEPTATNKPTPPAQPPKKQPSTETEQRAPPKTAPKREEPRPSGTIPLPGPETKTTTPRKAEPETAAEKKASIGIPPSPPVSIDWISAQLHRAAKGERRAVDSLYQRSLYVQDYLAVPTDGRTYSVDGFGDMKFNQNHHDTIVAVFDMLVNQDGLRSLVNRFDRFYQRSESKTMISVQALNDPKIGELEELMSDPSNRNHTIAKADLFKRPDLLISAVRLMGLSPAATTTTPGFMEYLIARAQDKDNPDTAKLLAIITDPNNTNHSISGIDRISQGRLLGEAVRTMRLFFYKVSEQNKTFDAEVDKVGYTETLFIRFLPGSGLGYPTERHSGIEPVIASPQLLSAAGLYMSRFDTDGKQRQGVAPWRPPAVVPRPEPEEPAKKVVAPVLKPKPPQPATVPEPLPSGPALQVTRPQASGLPKLSEDAVKKAAAEPQVLWEGTSISDSEMHLQALGAQLKTRSRKAHVDGRGEVSAVISTVRRNMESDLHGTTYNTVVFEAGVNDLQGVINRIGSGELKTSDQINRAVDAVFAQTLIAARSALSKGKVLILLTVAPWGGYQESPQLQAAADIVTERFNSQIMSLSDPTHGIFVVDMQEALGSKEMPKNLSSKPPAGWPANHSYTPANTTLWLSQEFRGPNQANDPRTGYLHFNDAGHTAMGNAVARIYTAMPVRAPEPEKRKEPPPPRPEPPKRLPVIPL